MATHARSRGRLGCSVSDPNPMLPVYAPSLSCDALHRLRGAAATIHSHAPAFAAWLDSVALAEMSRKSLCSMGRPDEPDPIVLPLSTWSDTDIGQALVQAEVLRHILTEPPTNSLALSAYQYIVTEARRRLCGSGRTPASPGYRGDAEGANIASRTINDARDGT